MTAIEIIKSIRARGVSVCRCADRIILDGPLEAITDPLRRLIKAHKADILKLLADDNRVTPQDVSWLCELYGGGGFDGFAIGKDGEHWPITQTANRLVAVLSDPPIVSGEELPKRQAEALADLRAFRMACGHRWAAEIPDGWPIASSGR